jgi:hypothetical protein
MEGTEATHGEPDDVSRVDFQGVEHVEGVLDRVLL